MKSRTIQSLSRVAFTLVELLVSTAIISLIMLVLVSITNQTTQTWQYTTEKIEKFQEARDGFESMTRRISQATLNTYWEYLDASGDPRPKDVGTTAYNNFVPNSYGRMSSLRFISGPILGPPNASLVQGGTGNWPTHGIFFQAPLGLVEDEERKPLNNLLNTWGYFVEIDNDFNRPPFLDPQITPQRWRSRLMEFMQPSERMSLHDVSYIDTTTNWFATPFKIPNGPNSQRPVRTLAENVTALIIIPKLTKQDEVARTAQGFSPILSPDCIYDSRLNLNSVSSGYVLNVGAKVNSSNPADAAGINPKNQLPPIVQVTMISIDERSAARLDARYPNNSTLGLSTAAGKAGVNLNNLFKNAEKLEDNPGTPEPGDGDLSDYEKVLVNEGLTYRVFTTNVSIRGAKWSRAQTK